MADPQGPEPSGWELMRGLDEVKRSVEQIGGRVVSIDLFNQAEDTKERRFTSIEDDVKQIQVDAKQKAQRDEERDNENRKFRINNGVAIALGVFGLAVSIFLALNPHGGV
jgi:hypothetical protein